MATHMIPGKVYGCTEFQEMSLKNLIQTKIVFKIRHLFLLLFYDVYPKKCSKIAQQLQVEIEDGRKAP